MWDVSSSARVDHFIANSRATALRIGKYYRREAEVIHPPVDAEFFRLPETEPAREYFLIVSALVPYKLIDLAVAAFNRVRLPLKIVGQGPEEKKLRRLAGPTVSWLGAVGADDLRLLYQGARALIMPGEEDFGITALEAQACGTPVIALGRGGALESVRPHETGLFFEEANTESLLATLDNFGTLAFNKHALRAQAEAFARGPFKERIAAAVLRTWQGHKDRS
jgi:glycosyltransferase involved in cell wall biosynthesis